MRERLGPQALTPFYRELLRQLLERQAIRRMEGGSLSDEQIESMGAQFVFLDFEEAQQDGAATGGYAAPSSPEFLAKQLEKFRALAPVRR